ncbi:type II toxin-antitoxin system VapC family toxin [Promineifilum sp.]|uniref:type II toxin-antitoxin system VapC family toxin n=1 Tax=Promineifilum sp. TaxID=2664178 RepID=UPI0035AF8098
MSGSRALLDTNALIYFFEGREKITQLVARTPELFYASITEIELLSSPRLTAEIAAQIRAFLALCRRIELSDEVIERAIEIRRDHRLKVPDAVIAASALAMDLPLVSADTTFQRVRSLGLTSDIV